MLNNQTLYDLIEESNLSIQEVMEDLYCKLQVFDFLVVANERPTLIYIKFSKNSPFTIIELD